MAENKEVKRLNYFTSQFLQEDDFKDEQAYHMRMRRLHNRALHTWGVVEGLVVSLVSGSKSVAITPGTAIDNAGREIVLPSDPAPEPIPLTEVTRGTDVSITIAYREVDDPADKYTTAGVEGKFKRKTERPLLKPDAAPPNDGSVIILAEVSVDSNGNIGNPDNTVRRLASAAFAPATDLEVRSLRWANDSRLSVDQGGSIELGGSMDTAGTGTPYIDFHFSGKTEDFNARIINEADGRLSLQAPVVRATGNVGIGTPSPLTQLHIRKDGAGALGPSITLMNGGGSPGAGASIDFDGYDTAANAPTLRIQSLDDGNFSSHLSISTKKSGAAANSLEERVRITSGGSVGFGTPSPDRPLTVYRSGAGTGVYGNVKNDSHEILIGVDSTAILSAMTASDLHIRTNNATRMLIQANTGNVGIGTGGEAPVAKLQVAGGAIMPAAGNTEASGILFPRDPGGGTGDVAWIRYYARTGRAEASLENTTLEIGNANDPQDHIALMASGNVGIGTPTPDRNLSVFRAGAGTGVYANVKNDTHEILVGVDSTAIVSAMTASDLQIRTNNATRMTVQANTGNVGIGTPAPGRKLVVDGNATILASPVAWGEGLRIIAKGNDTYAATLYGRSDADNQALWFTGIGAFGDNNRESDLIFLSGPGRGAPDTAAFGASSLGSTHRADAVMVLEHSTGNALFGGSVGIGTPTPARTLDVKATSIKLGLEANGGGQLIIANNPNDNKIYLEAFSADGTGTAGELLLTGKFGAPVPKMSLIATTTEITGNLRVGGAISAGGGKGGFVVDQFINKLGDTVESGDVVVIGPTQSSLFYGENDNIPIPEVDFAEQAYDTAVCGIVHEVFGELKPQHQEGKSQSGETGNKEPALTPQQFTPDESEQVERTQVRPEQIGWMVTLGAYAHCKVDADIAPIKVGDLLTTSPTKGHAQKVLDTTKATGAIIGKALGSLKKGKGKIPVLVTLQ